MKRKLTALLAALCITAVLPVHAGAVDLPLTSRAAVLMEKTTGQMLFAQNAVSYTHLTLPTTSRV